jgi:hypothetical protein
MEALIPAYSIEREKQSKDRPVISTSLTAPNAKDSGMSIDDFRTNPKSEAGSAKVFCGGEGVEGFT